VSPRWCKVGPFSMDLEERVLLREGKPVTLTPKLFETLRVLVEMHGRIVEKDELLKQVWPDAFVEEGNLSVNVFRLREALSDNEGSHQYIETIPRRGYRFVAAVTQGATATGGQAGQRSASAQDGDVHAVAVLPFENMSHDASQDYLADGMTDALITALSKTGRLRVISRTSVLQYGNARKPLPEIARELGVEFIVEGSVLQIGNRVRIAAQLIDGARDHHIWAERYEEDFSDMFSLLDQTAMAVASAVAGTMGKPAGALAGTAKRIAPEAWQAYMKGRHELNRFTQAGLFAAIEWYGKAIQADPNFGLAYSALALIYSAMASPLAALPPRELFGKAEAAARKALSIDGSNAEARWVLGLTEIMFHWNWKAGERETRLALAIDPSNAAAHTVMAVYHIVAGENSRAVDECEQACLLDPFSPNIRRVLYLSMYLARQYEEAKERILADKDRLSGFFQYHGAVGVCAIRDEDWETAGREFQMAVESSGGSSHMKAGQGYALAASGRVAEARAIYQDLIQQAKSRYVPATDLAILATGLGETEEALDWLDKAYEERSTHLIFIAIDFFFVPLRKIPRFCDLVRRMGLPTVPA